MARPESRAKASERLEKILDTLADTYHDAQVGLTFQSPFELLIATILSAQCTDERVNQVTPKLFTRFPNAEQMALADLNELEQLIFSTGFYKNKARNIANCSKDLVSRYNGQVPRSMEELIGLPGVGRKTANCVLSNCFNIPAVTVDTHVIRITNLLGLANTSDAVKIESIVMKILPAERWNEFDLLIITHGRRTCIARRPKCSICSISLLCPSAK